MRQRRGDGSTSRAASSPAAAPAGDPGERRRDWLVAGFCGLVGCVTLGSVDVSNGQADRPPLLVILALVLCTVAVVRRRRRPMLAGPLLLVLVVVALIFKAGLFAFVLMFELVLSAALYATPGVLAAAVLATVAVCSALGLRALLEGVQPHRVYLGALQNFLLVLAALSSGIGLRSARDASARERELLESQHRLAAAEHRAKLARDMHDLVAGRLTGIHLQASMARRDVDPDTRLGRLVEDIESTSQDVLNRVRAMIKLLATDPATAVADSEAGEDAAARLRDLVGSASLLGVDLRLADAVRSREGRAVRTLYLCAHECVVNMFRHASGCRGEVRLSEDDTGLHLRAWNTAGRGRASAEENVIESRHQGLDGLRQRAEAIGGSAEWGGDDDGWQVSVDLPARTPGRAEGRARP